MLKPLRPAPLNGLHEAPRNHTPKKIPYESAPADMRKAAEMMEATFTEMMMKSMRDSGGEPSELSLHNHASDIYQGMLDSEYAETSARAKSLGLAEQIVDYMLRSQGQTTYNNNTAPKAATRTGGTNEGQSGNQ